MHKHTHIGEKGGETDLVWGNHIKRSPEVNKKIVNKGL